MTSEPAASAPPRIWIEYPILYHPPAAVERHQAARRLRNGRIVSLVVSALISVAIWYFFRDQLGPYTGWVLGLSLAYPAAMLVVAIVRELMVRSDLKKVHDGLALGVTREGILVEQTWLPWEGIRSIATGRERRVRSTTLVLTPTAGPRVTVPLDYLAATPATVDNCLRALSGGRVWVDFSRFEG